MRRGFTCGAFDLLHPGHLHLLEYAKRHCDYLIVGLHTDPSRERLTKERPAQTTFERWAQLSAVKHVDAIIPYDTEQDLCNLLATLDLQVRFLGSDYQPHQYFTGAEICKARVISVVYVPRLHSFSSSDIRARLRVTP